MLARLAQTLPEFDAFPPTQDLGADRDPEAHLPHHGRQAKIDRDRRQQRGGMVRQGRILPWVIEGLMNGPRSYIMRFVYGRSGHGG